MRHLIWNFEISSKPQGTFYIHSILLYLHLVLFYFFIKWDIRTKEVSFLIKWNSKGKVYMYVKKMYYF